MRAITFIGCCLVSAAAWADPPGPTSPTVDEALHFADGKQKLFDVKVKSSASYVFGSSEVNKLSTHTGVLNMIYEAGADQASEVGLFASDVSAVHDATVADLVASGLSRNSFLRWDRQPEGVEQVYPTSFNVLSSTYTASAGVNPSEFSGVRSSSIKTVIIYNDGGCSRSVDLQPVVDSIRDKILKALKVVSGPSFGRVGAYLKHKTSNPQDVGGGLMLGGNVTIGLPVVPNEQIKLLYDFPVQLIDGIMQFGRQRQRIEASGVDFNGSQQKIVAAVEDGVHTAVDQLNQSVAIQQSVPIGTCNPGAPDYTAAKALMLVSAGLGAKKLNVASADFAMVQKVIQDPRRWMCVHDDGSPQPTAGITHFVIPAKRMNLYPDRVVLVWWDRPSADSPAYAAYLAALGAGKQSDLCYSPAPRPKNDMFDSHTFAGSLIGLTR